MRVSLRWLADYIDLPTDEVAEIRHALASLGHEVESVSHLEADWKDVFVAQVDHIRPHPGADRIRLCTVNTGKDRVEVVCGAWNFEEGAKVAFAPPGAVLAGGMEIGRREIRGIDSAGMICSEKELGLSDDHTGILVLDPDAPLGVPLTELIARPDVVLDVSITPNRPDVMSMIGIARELAAYFQVPYHLPPVEPATVPGETRVQVEIEDPAGCYRFVAREIKGVTIGPSPYWMRQRLRAGGVRPISNVVDVTNYVMLELGQPLHAFDLDRLNGERIVVRRPRPGETLVTLDGVERTLLETDLVVADGERASGLAGTMGGRDSEVGDDTSRVLLEAAAWDPPTIMFMSRRLGLRSEASARFERGVDPNLPPVAAARATRLLLELTGGESPQGWVDQIAVPHLPTTVELPLAEVKRHLGDDVPLSEVASLLTRLHLQVAGEDPLEVSVPTFRRDLERPIDLVEEVARLHGYDGFSETVPTGSGGGWTREQRRRDLIRVTLTGAGLSEALNLSFLGVEDLDSFAYPHEHEARLTVRVSNPLNDELASLRTSLLPGLLRSARYNQSRGLDDVALFEIGRVFFNRPWEEDPRIPAQPERLGFVVAGGFGAAEHGSGGRQADAYTATALWRLLAGALGLEDLALVPATPPGFHPGRAAQVVLDGQAIGVVGELHPLTAQAYDLSGRVAAGEIALAPLTASPSRWLLREPSVYPPVEFDLAFDAPSDLLAATLLEAIFEAGPGLIESAAIFDEYRGPGLDPGRKGLAVRVVVRAADRTLAGDDIEGVRRLIREAVADHGVKLRGE
ncbi:MAG TPA: phenylalanine--tRNA ligase subunit beta [Acidimicrobiia bacterium]|nr:phenylalanine--tRNA ligase subunit beta [Acidimicrobiia bacterium]